jgi:hypothetical protein
MKPKEKFVLCASAVAALTVANNIGFRGNCEIHEFEPACNGIGSDPLHMDHEMPFLYGTNTATLTSSGGQTGAMEFSGVSASTGTVDLQRRLPNDEAADFAMNDQGEEDSPMDAHIYNSAPVHSKASA